MDRATGRPVYCNVVCNVALIQLATENKETIDSTLSVFILFGVRREIV